jgi:hypothetical protein
VKTCSVTDCGREVHSRDWCRKHYQHWNEYGDPLRKLFPKRRNKNYHIKFTPALWQKWMARDAATAHRKQLADGIEELRYMLNSRTLSGSSDSPALAGSAGLPPRNLKQRSISPAG